MLGIFPADHYIEDDEEFRSIIHIHIHRAEELAAEGYLVTVGIREGSVPDTNLSSYL
ncbi:MAG: hypothetical protein PHT79_11130 [Syntrophomonadaceae bacterium]|nr:hypothetical protein [Syntrophomonadaceae bacterium]